jgi:hypothetical protein
LGLGWDETTNLVCLAKPAPLNSWISMRGHGPLPWIPWLSYDDSGRFPTECHRLDVVYCYFPIQMDDPFWDGFPTLTF